MIATHDSNQPKTVDEAISSSAKEQWIKAMEKETKSMKVNHVWDLVDLQPNRKAIGNKWVSKIKHNADDTIEKKQRLLSS